MIGSRGCKAILALNFEIIIFDGFEDLDAFGVLDNSSTSNRGFFNKLKEMGGNLIAARVVDDGDIITAGGVTASIDLGRWLVQKYCGIERAIQTLQDLEYESRGPIWQRA